MQTNAVPVEEIHHPQDVATRSIPGIAPASRPPLRYAVDGEPWHWRQNASLTRRYNNRDDVDALLAALHKLSDFF